MSARADLPLALATLSLVPTVYAAPLPTEHATTLAACIVGAVVAVTGSPTVAVLGGAAVVAFACLYSRRGPNARP